MFKNFIEEMKDNKCKDLFSRELFEHKCHLHATIAKAHNEIGVFSPETRKLMRVLAKQINNAVIRDTEELLDLASTDELIKAQLTTESFKSKLDKAFEYLSQDEMEKAHNIPEYMYIWNVAEKEFNRASEKMFDFMEKISEEVMKDFKPSMDMLEKLAKAFE